MRDLGDYCLYRLSFFPFVVAQLYLRRDNAFLLVSEGRDTKRVAGTPPLCENTF